MALEKPRGMLGMLSLFDALLINTHKTPLVHPEHSTPVFTAVAVLTVSW